MLQPLVVGLGRSGAGLHLKILTRTLADGTFHGPVVAYDARADAARGLDQEGVTIATTLRAAVRQVDPESTVVHVCTPPVSRLPVLEELARSGFRLMLVEKPLAIDETEAAEIERLRDRYRLRLVVVAHWLSSALTERLEDLVRQRSMGRLVAIHVAQHKPRILRSLTTGGHPTAFDVEIPHSLGVVLRLAGSADLVEAECTDMRCENTVLPRMGSARLVLRHRTGAVTEIASDLTAPVRQRSIRLEFEQGSATGHYPLSEDDDHAQLITGGDRHVFRDDALSRFLHQTYRTFQAGEGNDDFALHCSALRLLSQAKDRCRDPDETGDDHAA